MKNIYVKYIMRNITPLLDFTKKDQVEIRPKSSKMIQKSERDQVKVSKSQSLMEKFKGLEGERISGLEVIGGSRAVVDTYFPCVLSRIVSKRSRNALVNGSFLRYAAILALILCLGVGRSFAVDYCQSSAFGYGASATGGGSATPVLVNSVSGLQSALNKGKNKVIIITQSLTFTSMLSVQDGENVTLLGLPGVTLTSLQQDKSSSGILYVKRFNNLIIRNLTFVGPGAYDCDGNDLLCFEKVTNAWVDHCDFQDGVDGNFDNKSLTDNVTVSWCRFRYLKAPKAGGSGGSDDHRFTNLLGSSSSDAPSDGTYNLTWAYCWWDDGCKERMVRCRNAELHFLNCYWNSSVANYYVGPENAKCYFDGCTFEGKANSSSKIFKSYGGTNACKFVGCSGNTPSNSGTISAPSYSYASYTFANAAAAKTAVTNASCGAGATLTVTTAGVISSTCDGGVAPTVYTVTWDAATNGGSCGTATTSVTSGNAIGSLPEATKSGYTFDGWYTASSGGIKISSSTTVTGNVTYYAQFTSTPVTTYYTVIWDANGGSCGTASTSVEDGHTIGSVVSPLPTATKSDNTFDGWFTSVSGGTQITTSTTVTANVTYYAHYTPTGGGGGGECATKTIGFTTATCAKSASSGGERTLSSVTNLTVAHEVVSTTSGAIATYGNADKTGIKYNNSTDVFSRGGYKWNVNTGSTLGTTNNTVGFSVTVGSGYEFTIDSISFGIAASANMVYQIIIYQSGDTLYKSSEYTLNKGVSNYEFHVGNLSSRPKLQNLTGTFYVRVRLAFGSTGKYLFFPMFQVIGDLCEEGVTPPSPTYTLSYDENGGSGSAMADQVGTTLTVAANSFTAPTGYAFQKWNTAMNGGGTDYAAGGSITLTEDVTLYAIWQAQTYTVTLNQGSGSGGTASVTATFDAAMPSITVPTRSGYTFAGYFTAANGEGTQYYDENGSSTNDWTIANNTTLYANWTEGSAPVPTGCDLHFHFFYAADATSNSLTNDATVFTSMVSDGSAMAGSITIDGTSYSVTRRTGDNATFGTFTIPSGKTGTFYALAVSSGAGDRQINLVCGGTTYELPVEGGSGSYKRLEQGDLPAGTYSIQREGSSNVRLGVVVVKLCADVSCASAYSFHYGPHTGDWETPICFEQVGVTHEWQITDFVIPSHASGEFYVGYEGSTNGQSVTRAWTYGYSDGNGAMKLLPTSSSIVGQAAGAKGTISIWDDSGWQNQNVGFTPDGYGITYGGVGHAFNTTATANMWETDVVTLPDVSTTYTMGLATSSAGTYVTCAHSSAAEAISNMGVSILDAGKKKILLVPGSFNTANAVYAVWDGTNSAWGDGTTKLFTDADGDGVWECPVASSCTSINLVRMSSGTTASNIDWSRKWNQTANISVGDLLNKYTITSLSDDNCAYTTTAIHPATGDKGKFRMWANSADNNWYVHWIPYYVLSYDGNGGTGTTAATERNSESVTLTVNTAANGFTAPTGYQFAGWANSDARADAGTVDYAAGASYSLTSNATLYAVWQAKSCTITLNNQSATNAGTASVTATYNASTNLLVPISCPSKTGYFFDGYYTETGGNGTQLIDRNGNFIASVSGYTDASRNWIHDGDVTLYAKWTELTVTLTVSPSTIAPSTATNVTYTITTNAPTGTTIPYSFAIFNFGASDNTSGYLDGGHNINSGLTTTVSMNMSAGTWYTRAVILWSGSELVTSAKTQLQVGNLYTVTYAYNGATGGNGTASETAASVMLPTPTRTGYEFDGWYTTAGTKVGAGGATYNPTADITLYARWEETCAAGGSTTLISYTMTAECTSTDPCSETASGTPGGTAYLYKLKTSNSTYKLNNDASDGKPASYFSLKLSNGYYQSGDVLTIDGSKAMDVYTGAHGSGSELGVTSAPSDGVISYTLPNTLPNNTNELYVYRTSSTYNGTLTYMTVTRSGGGGGTCYHIYYHGNGAESGFVSDTTSYANSATATILDYDDSRYPLTKAGYTFQGWATSAEGSVAKTAGQTVTISRADVHYYAVWAAACSSVPTVTAGTYSAVTSTTATVSCVSGISSLGTGGCTISSYGFVIGTSANPEIGGSGVTQHEVGTSYAVIGSSFSKNLTGLDASTTYYVRPYATNGYGTGYGTQTSFTTAAPPTYTLTVSGALVANPMREEGKTGAISGVTITGSPVSGIASGTTTSTSNNTFSVNKGTPATVTASAIVSGSSAECDECTYVFDHWTNVPASVTADVSNIQAVYNTTYTIAFRETDGTTIADASDTYYVYGVGKTVATFPTPTKSGYEFGGWYKETSLTNAATDLTGSDYGNITYYAKWIEIATLACGTLYKVEDMVPASITLSGTGQYAEGISSNGIFTTIGDPAQTSNAGGTPEMKNESSTTIAGESFTGRMYFKGASNTTGSGTTFVPTSRAIKFVIAKNGTLDIYAHRVDRLYLKKAGDSGTTQLGSSSSTTPSKVSHSVTAGTYYIYSVNSSDCVYGMQLNCAYTVTYKANGSGESDEVDDDAKTIAANPFTWSGHTFVGWNTADDGSGTPYAVGATVSADLTLYAQWKSNATDYSFSNGSFTDWGTCNGGTLTLSGSQSGVSYQLYKDGVASGDAKAGTGSVLNWTVTSSGTYTVKSVENASYVETAMTGSAVVTLQDPTLSGESTVEMGSTITLTHPGYSIAGDNWTSSNTSVATVSNAGVVTGVAAGTATITFHGVGACDGSKLITVTVSYTVTYNYNGATSGDSPASATGASVTLPTPTRTGYVLDGWYKTDGTKVGDGGDTYNPTANITLYAKWEEICAADGVGIEWDFTSMSERSFTTSNTGTGGNVNEISSTTGSGTLYYYAGSSCAITEKNSTMCLALGGGSSSGSVNGNSTYQNRCFYIDIASNGTLLIRHNSAANNAPSYQITSATRPGTSGYTSQSAVGTGDDAVNYQISVSTYNASTACRIWVIYPNKSYIEKITWTPVGVSGTCFHVTYDGNGATSGFVSDTTSYKNGDEVTVLGNDGRYPYVKEGYEIVGWADTKMKADAGTIDYAIGSTFDMPASDKTLYAVWSNEFTITYHLNGASWADAYVAPSGYEYGTGATLPIASNMTNIGYTFNGWYDNEELTGDAITAVGTSDVGNKEFWAKWTENTYTITYNANGGTGDAMSNTVGHYVTLSKNTYTKDGCIFTGWNTATDGSGTSYNDEEDVELTANLTLYAQWGAVVTATWSVTKVDDKLYRGGGGYHVTVYLNQADWDVSGDKDDLELTATEGVTLKNVTKSINGSDKAQVEADFDITTDLAADATEISFTLSVPAAGSYSSAELNHSEDLDDCSGGSGTSYKIPVKSAVDDQGSSATPRYLWETSGIGWITWDAGSSSISSESASYSGFSYRTGSGKNTILIYSEIASVKKIRIYGYGSNATSCNGVATGTTYNSYSNLTQDTHYSFNGNSVTKNDNGVIEIIFTTSLAANTYVKFTFSSNAKFYGVEVETSGSGSGDATPTLTWETDLSGGVTAETGDADFTHTASTTSNTLGAITYSSNNTSVATVNAATGKVHIVGAAGSATITATLAASGCYEEATASYDITVTRNCDDVAGTISTNNLGCAGIELTVTGHTVEAGVTYQWYKDGASISGATSATYTAIAEGEYYVVVTNTGERHCDMMSTNTVVIESASDLSVENIITSWYVKNGRRTPDIALVQTTGAEGFTVKVGGSFIWKSDGSVTTGLGGCNFRLGDDGIIYLCGTKPNGDAPNGLTGATDVILAINVTACGGSNEDASDITIHCQGTTSRPSIAFVVDGTEKGAFDAENESHSVNTALYKYLDYGSDSQGAFDLTGRNIYSTVDETAIREHYSQFDAILITDDPNTGKKKDGKSYVDAFGTMIDVRPILTMEAFVSKLKNWSCVKGDPSSPSPRQYEMKLQCKDHEIYSGLPEPAAGTHVWSETIDGEEYRHVVMVDKTKSPYSSLANDNTDTDGTPAMQGFASEAIGNLLGLGLIKDDELQAGVERQEEPAARMMILGIQNKALPNALTAEGKKVIENALTYLLKTNMEEVDDCSNFFKGGDPTKPRDWNTVANWAKSTLPNYETKVRILAPCELSGATVKVAQVDIATSGKSSKKDTNGGVCNGSLTIAADGALIVSGKIRTAEAPHFAALDLKPTTPTDLTVEANSGGNGALVLNNEDGTTQATIAMYSKAWRNKAENTTTWQYIGVPHSDVGNAKTNYYDSWLYRWDPSEGWLAVPSGGAVEPWTGYCITHPEAGHTYWMQGTLEATADQAIDVPDGVYQVIGNSWTAPIYIAAFEDDDFENITKTIYFFNTGTDPEGDGDIDAGRWAAGTYVSAPIYSSPFTGDSLISSLQGFYVANTSGSAGTLHLDYDKLVRPRGSRNALAGQMHAPRRAAAISDRPVVAKLWVRGTRYDDRLVVLEREDFTEGYDAGWDGEKWDGSTIAPCVWSVNEDDGADAVTATPDFEGTLIGFRAGEDDEYTFHFEFDGMEDALYLLDVETQLYSRVLTGNTYTFTCADKGEYNRFILTRKAPSIGTGVNTGSDGVNSEKAVKFLNRDKMFIFIRGVLYDATGKRVAERRAE